MTHTSRVFQAARDMKARVAAQSWTSPAHNPALGLPQIAFAKPTLETANEIIQIIPKVEAGTIEDVSKCERDEVFDVVVEFTSVGTTTDEDLLLTRLEVVADVIQEAFYDGTTFTPLPDAEMLEGVGNVDFEMFEQDNTGTLVGSVTVRYRTHYRI